MSRIIWFAIISAMFALAIALLVSPRAYARQSCTQVKMIFAEAHSTLYVIDGSGNRLADIRSGNNLSNRQVDSFIVVRGNSSNIGIEIKGTGETIYRYKSSVVQPGDRGYEEHIDDDFDDAVILLTPITARANHAKSNRLQRTRQRRLRRLANCDTYGYPWSRRQRTRRYLPRHIRVHRCPPLSAVQPTATSTLEPTYTPTSTLAMRAEPPTPAPTQAVVVLAPLVQPASSSTSTTAPTATAIALTLADFEAPATLVLVMEMDVPVAPEGGFMVDFSRMVGRDGGLNGFPWWCRSC